MAKKETKRTPPAAWAPCKDCATPEACESLKTLWGNRAEVCDIARTRSPLMIVDHVGGIFDARPARAGRGA
jgi:hypothetical protein